MTARSRVGGGWARPPRVVITSQGALRMLTGKDRSPEDAARAMRLTEPFQVRWETHGDPTRLAEALCDADLLVTENEVPITREALERAECLRLIQVNGYSCRSVDLEAARELDIRVATLPPITSDSVAEHTLALMLALARRLRLCDRIVRAGDEQSGRKPVAVAPGRALYNWPEVTGLRMLGGATLSVLGLGDIGCAVARLANAFGMHVCYWQRHRLPAAEEARLGVRYVGFEEAFAVADWLTVHVPFTEETRSLVGAKELTCMRSTAFLINTARGPIVDEAALVDALRHGRLAGAGLDVFPVEPPPADHPLHAFDNVVLTPHCAAGDLENAMQEVKILFAELRRVWEGHPSSYPAA